MKYAIGIVALMLLGATAQAKPPPAVCLAYCPTAPAVIRGCAQLPRCPERHCLAAVKQCRLRFLKHLLRQCRKEGPSVCPPPTTT